MKRRPGSFPPPVQILWDLPRYQANAFVFPSPVKRGEHRRDFKRARHRIRKRADPKDITMHDLRRTAGSFMAQSGVPLQVIQHVLGHSHPGVTKLYARLASENQREALETLAEELGDVLATSENPSRNGSDPEPPGAFRCRLSALLAGGRTPRIWPSGFGRWHLSWKRKEPPLTRLPCLIPRIPGA